MKKIDDKTLAVKWSKKENDFMIYYPRGCDGHLVHNVFNHYHLGYEFSREEKSFMKDLEERGYDLTTLEFKVRLKENVKGE